LGIEVKTQIILGLPGDTPEGFRHTLEWLKRTASYSQVQAFVLLALPGTDFRVQSKSLGLNYNPRPPYEVWSTLTFPENELKAALLEFERLFTSDRARYYPLSLVDRGPGVITSPDGTNYISTWIISTRSLRNMPPSKLRIRLSKATDPFTIWFRGEWTEDGEKAIMRLLGTFIREDPHAVLHVVFEFTPPPEKTFLRKALETTPNLGREWGQDCQPLFDGGLVPSVDFTVILPYLDDAKERSAWKTKYAGTANVIWHVMGLDKVKAGELELPVLISSIGKNTDGPHLVEELKQALGAHSEVLFRDASLQHLWRDRILKWFAEAILPEKILLDI
jgi:hypothetical protein